MKQISQRYRFDASYFSEKIPSEAQYLPDPRHEYPVYLKHNLLDRVDCDQMVSRFVAAGAHGPAMTERGDRKAEIYLLEGENESIYQGALEKIKQDIETFFSLRITGSTGSHGLGYNSGCLYGVHSDNCEPVLDDNGELLRFEYSRPDRQISSLLYLTDSVTEVTGDNHAVGGNLSFPFLRDEKDEMLLIEPEKGLFIAFPSNPIFAHEVHMVYEGYRMAIVDWLSARPA